MSPIQLPHLDPNQLQQFTISFSYNPITFKGYPLSLPESYLTINFCKEIHQDNHWDRCPWGSYWDLGYTQPEPIKRIGFGVGQVGRTRLYRSDSPVVQPVQPI